MRYVLGLDGGGTKCDAVLMAEDGTVMGWGRGGPTHGLYVGPDVPIQSQKDAILGATGGSPPPLSRIAGLGLVGHLHQWLNQDLCAEQFVPCGEADMGLATALTTHGILVLSGTGSFVHGRTPDGRHMHLGGNGPIIADEGSAYHIGILGIRAAFRSKYSEARRTSLREAVPKAMGVAGLREVFHLLYIDRVGRTQIAAVARAVDMEAEKGDRVAAQMLRKAADELGELLVEVITELDMTRSDAYMVATGSVAQGSRIFWDRLCEIAAGVAPDIRPVQPKVRPVVGACLMGLKALEVPWTEALLERIIETQEPFLARLRSEAEDSNHQQTPRE
ncbi:MAG: hypothetical protein HPY44_19850 [Armatimonadetes bacterium]|nr:hypothetical protein [Armatimonadota bacterium]